jgi:hypothetical protein
MTIKLFSLFFIVLLLLTQPPLLLAQNVPQQQNWATIQALSPGVKLLIETNDKKRFEGKLRSATETTLTLDRSSGAANLNKTDIQRIYRLGGGSRVKTAVIGTAVGAGVGAGASLVLLGATGGSDDFNGILGTGILIGAGIGAALGAALGKSRRRELIYESK